MICRRSTRFSASSARLDRNSPTSAHQVSLQKSHIGLGDTIKKRLCAQVDELSDGASGALDPAERAERTAAIKAQILEAKRIEESVAYQLLKEEQPIQLRADETFDPRAMLSVE